LANFEPSTGREYRKIRPAVVVQSAEVSSSSPYVSVMPISSKVEKVGQYDVLLSQDTSNKLQKDSVIRVQQISSFDKRRIIGVFGEVSGTTSRKVRGYIRRHFGL